MGIFWLKQDELQWKKIDDYIFYIDKYFLTEAVRWFIVSSVDYKAFKNEISF